MPDLHDWITQQITRREAVANAATPGPWTVTPVVYGKPEDGYGPPANFEIHAGRTEVVGHQPHEGGGIYREPDAEHIAAQDPAAVLRRCEADRRILNRHRLDPDAVWYQAAMCEGCGTYGEYDYPETENLSDCPELLDLGYAHGLTDEILASLDRPQEGERPEHRPGFGMPDVLLESMYRAMYEATVEADRWLITGDGTGEPRGVLAWKPREPTPMDRALDLLGPELRRCPLYDAGPPAVRGPYWKARP